MNNRIAHIRLAEDSNPEDLANAAARTKAIETMELSLLQLGTAEADVATEIGKAAGILGLLHRSLSKKQKAK